MPNTKKKAPQEWRCEIWKTWIHWQDRGSRECLGCGRGLQVCPVEDGHRSLLASLLHLYHQTFCVQLYLMDGHILGALWRQWSTTHIRTLSKHGPTTNGLITGVCLWSHHDRRHLIMCILMSAFMCPDNVNYVITNRHWQKGHLIHFEFISLKCHFRIRVLIESQLMRSSEPEIMKMWVI